MFGVCGRVGQVTPPARSRTRIRSGSKLRNPWPQRSTFFTQRLTPSVGPLLAPVVWWASISWCQDLSVAEADDLSHVVGQAAGDGLGEQRPGITPGVSEVDVALRFLGQPGPSTSSSGSPTCTPNSIRSRPRSSRRSLPVSSSLRIRHSGSRLRPRWPTVSFWTRRRTLSTQRLAALTTWNGSATRRARSRPGDSPARKLSAKSVATT
jgi:hypothetical protein